MLEAISWLTNLGKMVYPRTMKTIIELLNRQGWIFLNLS